MQLDKKTSLLRPHGSTAVSTSRKLKNLQEKSTFVIFARNAEKLICFKNQLLFVLFLKAFENFARRVSLPFLTLEIRSKIIGVFCSSFPCRYKLGARRIKDMHFKYDIKIK